MSHPRSGMPSSAVPANPGDPRTAWLVCLGLLASGCVENHVKHVEELSTAAPRLSVEPDTLDFGSVELGGTATGTVTLTNVGDADLTLAQLSVQGAATYFAILDTLAGTVLEPGGSVDATLTYTALGDPGTTALWIDSDDPVTPSARVPLEADLLVGALQVDPNPVDFGDTASGEVVERTALLMNVGTVDVTISGLLVSGTVFALPSPPTLPMTLPPGSNLPVVLDYAPVEEPVVDRGDLWVTADDPAGVHAVPLLGSTGLAIDEGHDDWTTCYDAATGYDTTAGAHLVVTRATVPITTTYMGTDAGYNSDLYLLAPEEVFLAAGHTTAEGTQVTLGPYARGTELVFGIRVRDTGDEWSTGPGTANADGQVHGAITYNDDCMWTVGFEDMNGGGDTDYNDIVMRVEGALSERP